MATLNLNSNLGDADRISVYHWFLFITCFLSNVLAGVASTLMSVYLPVVVKDLLGDVDPVRYSDVSAYINALYFIGWAFGGFTWGMIGDKIGRARSLALAVAMYGIFTVLKGFAPSWEVMLFFQFFCGFGVGGVLVMNTTLMSEAWPDKTKAVFIGFVSVGFPVGIFSSGAVLAIMSNWRQGFLVGIIPVILALVAFLNLRESEKWKTSKTLPEEAKSTLGQHKKNLFNGSVIFGCMLIGLWSIFAWMPTWVQSLMTTSNGQKERALTMMLLGVGGLSGGFLSGWISNTMGTRKAMLMVTSVAFILTFLLFKLNSTFSTVTIIEIACLSFMFGISQGLLGVYIPLLFPVNIRGTATGFCFNVGRFVTAAAVLSVGLFVARLGGYGNALFAFSFVFLIGFLFLLSSKNKTTT